MKNNLKDTHAQNMSTDFGGNHSALPLQGERKKSCGFSSTHTQCIKVSLLVSVELLQVDVCPLCVLFFKIFVQRILVSENEVEFVVFSTFVRSKHNGVGRQGIKLLLKHEVFKF